MLFSFPLSPNPDEAANPVVGCFYDDRKPNAYPAHRHRRAQILNVMRGVMVVSTEDNVWVVPPHRAAWIPSGIEHSVYYPQGVALRSLYVDTSVLPVDLPGQFSVLQLDPLGCELIRAAAELPWEDRGSGTHLAAALFDRLSVLAQGPLHLPDGRDRRLVRVMDALRADPSDSRTLEEFALVAHCSRRTLARLFIDETKMSFGAWRQQLRLLVALEQLAAGRPVSRVALDLGYGTPSSFSTMFRRSVGTSPARYFCK